MESTNFNLKQSIDHYIGLIKNQGAITNSDEEELIGHLHDSTEALQQQGLSKEESFMIAIKRVGKVEVLTEEYGKVNTSLKSSQIWAYLLIGFNLFYSIPALVFTLIIALYYLVHKQYGTSLLAVSIVTAIHMLLIISLWSVLKYKRKISDYIQIQVERNPVRLLVSMFIPLIINILFTSPLYKLMPGMSFNYPIHRFDSDMTEFSFYLMVMSIIGVLLSLIFSINKLENFSLKTLFSRPSFTFLALFGFAIELLAASTRSIYINNMVVQGIVFGTVYAGASFLIAYYNEAPFVNKYLLICIALGLIIEVSFGISADLGRGDTYFTIYFTVGLIAGVAIGRFLGLRLSEHSETPKLERIVRD